MKILQLFFPLGTALLIALFFLWLPDLRRCPLPTLGRETPRAKRPAAAQSERETRLTRADALPILLITLLYAAAAFFNLGDRAAPQSFAPMRGQSAVLTLPEGACPSALMLYCGVGHGEYTIDYSPDGLNWEPATAFSQGHVEVLKWHTLSPDTETRPVAIRISCTSGEPWLGELVPLNGDGLPIPCSCSVPALCDEPELAPARMTYHNSSYFDEIYHARTAWEHLHGVWPYEISHPPLGKEILSLGILLFGMTPFGWRFMGTLFGAAMLPLLYLFLKKLFGSRAVSAAGTALFALDFMHYAQTRIATIDTYSVFFILLMYLFLYLWLSEDRLWALAACGISFGLGAAAKWTSIYAGAGLAVIWAGHWLLRFFEARGQEERSRGLFPAFLRNAAFCVVFFILVPCLIYYLSYLPYGAALGQRPFSAAYTRTVLDNQRYMFSYHVGVTATHPYSSRWYQWLLNIRPILYYLDYLPDGSKVSIAAFLNPMLCWGGLLSLFVAGYLAFARRSRVAAFLLVGYLAELLPWIFIQRLTFAYHYFPSSLFLVLTLSLCFDLLRRGRADWKLPVWGYVALAGLLFAVFFPTLNGLPIQPELASRLMKWLPTWPL